MEKPVRKSKSRGGGLPNKPRLLYLILCDAIADDAQGKKSLIGTFDRIWSVKFPCVFSRLHVVTGWEGLEGDYTMRVEIQNPDGRPIFTSPPLGLRFGRPLFRADMVIGVNGMKFDQPGIYSVAVFLAENTEPVLVYPLLVEKTDEKNMGDSLEKASV